MVLGFLGTLVALERAVALRRPWGYAAPVALGAGGVALLVPVPLAVGRVLLVAGCVVAVAVLQALWRRQRDDTTAAQVLAAILAVGAALLWTRLDVTALLPWLVGYIVVTVCAERVELARFVLPPWAGRFLLILAALTLAATVASLLWPPVGTRGLGVVVVVMVGWMVRGDVARRTIRSSGLPRFSAAALLLGYAWLAIAAGVWVVGGPPASEAAYDTVVHAAFLGFAMSMVMAHAPVILPAVLRRPLPYHATMWGPLVLLHVGLVLRVALGNGLGQFTAWQVGSVVGVVAVLGFVVTAARGVAAARWPGAGR